MEPMLATAVPVLPHGTDWSFEFKWDGVRTLLDASAGGVRLQSRRGNEVSTAYPELVAAAAGWGDVLLDGEIVAFVDGVPSFPALQTRMHVRARAEARRLAETLPVTYLVFDLLRVDGDDRTGRPLRERRAALDAWAAGRDVSLSPTFDDGAATLEVARASGLEGVVAKRLGSRYRPGGRTDDWRKLRFVRTGDFAVVGWEGPAETPDTLSSLLLGVVRDGALGFAGKVGSGLTGRTSGQLHRRLRPRADCPLGDRPPASPNRVTHWVEPELVVEVEFTVWTPDGRLRHPVFHRVRDDKTVEEATG